MAGVHGVNAKLAWGSALPVTDPLEFQRDTIACREILGDMNAIRGARGRTSNRKEVVQRLIEGDVECIPTAKEWTYIIPRAFGAAAVGTTYSLANTLPEFYHVADRGIAVHTFTGCKVNRFTLNAREQGGLQGLINIYGKDEVEPVGAAGTFPGGLVIDETTKTFTLPQGAVTIGGSSFQVDGIQFVLENFLQRRFGNSLTATDITPTDRQARFSCRVPWGDFLARYTLGATAAAIVATFTNGTVSLQLSMPSVRWPKQSAPVEDMGELWYSIEGECGIDAAGNPEVTIVLDSTP